ncbi:MAG: magnesium transporter, partial [Eudoraea sp.]
MTPFKLTDELLAEIELLIESGKDTDLKSFMEEIHYADIAEIANDLSEESATYLIKLLDSDKTSDVLIELDDDMREAVLNNLSSKEIAEELDEL